MTVVSPSTDAVLTTIFWIEVVAVVGTLLTGNLPQGCPVEGRGAVAVLALACALVFPVIFLVKRCAGVVGALISRHMKDDPLGKHRQRSKFEDQSWQFFIHASMTAFELHALADEPWLRDYTSLWTPHPRVQVHSDPAVHALYVMQLAIWIMTATSHRYFEERHKDYAMMFIHHIVTIALVWGSYMWGYVRIGVIVLLLHDSSDIVTDTLKCANYLKLEGPSHLFVTELSFVANLAAWGYARLYLFAVQVVWRGGFIGPREVLTVKGYPGMEAEDRAGLYRGHAPHSNVGDGSFSLLANVMALPTHPNLPMYWEFNTLMCALLIMHWLWYLLFIRILVKLIRGQSGHEAGAEDYEGDSD